MSKIVQRVNAAQALLMALGVADIHAVVAGGYARDTIADKKIRDIDVYVSDEDYGKAYITLCGEDVGTVHPYADDTEEYTHQSITRQCEYSLLADLQEKCGLEVSTVNLIGLTDALRPTFEDVTSKYNLGICQAAISYMHGLQISDQFRDDFKDKQITLLRTGWGHEATMKQFIKLQAKYPWPLRVKKETLDDFTDSLFSEAV